MFPHQEVFSQSFVSLQMVYLHNLLNLLLKEKKQQPFDFLIMRKIQFHI